MPVSVFLADLRHDYSGVLASDCMPLGISYMKAVMDRDAGTTIRSRLFAYPDALLSALKQSPPDVLMLTNYTWNEGLLRHFLRIARMINPAVLTVAGGPNIPIESARQEEYVKSLPDLDVYVTGEGDFKACEIARTFDDVGLSRSHFFQQTLSSCIIKVDDGAVINRPTEPRHRNLDEIPSAWLTGIQDAFFDGKLAPMIETNRGCPFTCTFCVQGGNFYTKVNHFSVDRIKEELRYIAGKIKTHSPHMGTLRIADSNYGMYERDIEISEFIGELQRDHGWPRYIDATTGKNRAERIIKSVEKVNGALVLYQAVQSLDETVLTNIRRQNIKLSAYKEIGIYMRGRGLKSVSDLILGLPGETLATHLSALKQLIDGDVDQMHNMQAMVLKGSELETIEARKLFRFDTRFRLVPKSFGVYGDERVFDTEEIIVATDTMSFDDYIEARKYHLASSIFWNNGWFSQVVRLSRAFGITNSEWWASMLGSMKSGASSIRGLLQDFEQDTIAQLFTSREECEAFYRQEDNFRRLRDGLIGDNLMYRYRAIASFVLWAEIASAAMQATKELLLHKGAATVVPDFDAFYKDLSTYVFYSHATGSTKESILAESSATLQYDLEAWLASDQLTRPQDFKLPEPMVFSFSLQQKQRQELADAFEVWGTAIHGLSKLVTRVSTDAQTRSCLASRSQGSELVELAPQMLL